MTYGKTKIMSCPGATSKETLRYLDVFLTNSPADSVILHVGVNDLLEHNSKSKIENGGENPESMVEKCHIYGIKNIFIKVCSTQQEQVHQFLRGLMLICIY